MAWEFPSAFFIHTTASTGERYLHFRWPAYLSCSCWELSVLTKKMLNRMLVFTLYKFVSHSSFIGGRTDKKTRKDFNSGHQWRNYVFGSVCMFIHFCVYMQRMSHYIYIHIFYLFTEVASDVLFEYFVEVRHNK